MRISTSQK